MDAEREVTRFVIGGVIGVVAYDLAQKGRFFVAFDPADLPVAGRNAPAGGKGHSFGQRMGRRRTHS